MDLINDLFSGYYSILVIVLALMVPIWFGTFLYEAMATVIERISHRGEPEEPGAPRQ